MESAYADGKTMLPAEVTDRYKRGMRMDGFVKRIDAYDMLPVLAPIILYFCEKIELGEENTSENALKIMECVSVIYTILNARTYLTGYAIDFILQVLQEQKMPVFVFVCAYMLIAALLSPISACMEKRDGFWEEKGYIWKNMFFNLMGVTAACAMFGMVFVVIEDFSVLKSFPIMEIVPIVASLCIALVLGYQGVEIRNVALDHDASTRWWNQRFNMFHLFQVYFLSLISVTFLASYTIYCHMHQRVLTMAWWHYFFLSLMLIFFYILSGHSHDYLWLVFVVMVPTILIASVYWMSWFSMSLGMRLLQWGFVTFHSIVYASLYYWNKLRRREEMRGVDADGEEDAGGKVRIFLRKLWKFVNKHVVMICLMAVVLGLYALIWVVPLHAPRISADDAEHFISKICRDTDVEAEDVIGRMESTLIYDRKSDDYGMGEYLNFLSAEFGLLLVEKGILESRNEILTYDKLRDWAATER